LIQLTLQEKLSKAGIPSIPSLFDACNAFPSSSHTSLATHADEGLPPKAKHYFETRRTNSQIVIPTSDDPGELITVPGCGALMGDSDAPSDFSRTYEDSVSTWKNLLDDTRTWARGVRTSQLTIADCMFSIDLSTTTYADDIARQEPTADTEHGLQYIATCTNTLTTELTWVYPK
jgi:hypothetical protein